MATPTSIHRIIVSKTTSGSNEVVKLADTESIDVSSNESGTIYLVNDNVTVDSLGDILDAPDDQWNSVQIVTPDVATPLEANGLTAGTYHAYAADPSGNLSDMSAMALTVV